MTQSRLPVFPQQQTFLSPAVTSEKVPTTDSFDRLVGAGKEANWVQTIPGKGWNTLLRLYGPLEPWFNKTWHPGEIEPM